MKRLLTLMMVAAFTTLAIVSCKDDFNEEDFLRLQSELKLKQDSLDRWREKALLDSTSEQAVKEYIAATNEAGDLLGVTLMVRENGTPVQGVSVSLTTSTPNQIANGRTKQTQTLVTDAAGNVVFDRVTMGSGTISFSKQGYISATATVDFGLPSGPTAIQVQTPTGIVTRYIPPTKRFEEAIVPMFSTTPSAGSTATIRGRVTYENDVTNLMPEVPQNLVLRANFSGLVASGQGFMQSFVLEDDSDLGRATVAANGEYTMTVPASATASTVTLIVPNITGTRRTAVNGYDDGTGTPVALPNGPEYRDVPVVWGQQANGVNTTIPVVVGAKVVFPAPPPAGSGLTFDFTPVPRSLPSNTLLNSPEEQNEGLLTRIISRGAYGTSLKRPTVTVTGGGGTGATAEATLRTRITNLTVTNKGSGYVGDITLTIRATRENGTTVDLSSVSVPSVDGGLPTFLDLEQLDGTFLGFGTDESELYLDGAAIADYASVSLHVQTPPFAAGSTAATVSATFNTDLAYILLKDGGINFVSAPTFTFSGGGAGVTHAQLVADGLEVYWHALPNNTASSNYAVLPDDFRVFYPATVSKSSKIEEKIDRFEISNGTPIPSNEEIENFLTVQNGQVVLHVPTRGLRTMSRWSVQPQMIITPEAPKIAKAAFSTNDIDNQTGEITIAFEIPSPANLGNGYDSPITATIQPAITGAPGSGASILLTNEFNTITKEYTWDGTRTLISGGSGYLRNLNRKGAENPTITFPYTITNVQAGKTYTANINFGTGHNQVNIN